jgi:hypothetical protein
MVSISRSIFLACGTTDIEQPMIRIRLYREGGWYVESVNNNKKGEKEYKKGGKNIKKEEREKEKEKEKEKQKEKTHVQ